MELSDFKTFDPRSIKGFSPESLKKINLEDVKALVMAKKWQVLAFVFAILGVVGSFQLYSFNSSRAADLGNQLVLLQNKEEPLAKFKKTMKDAQTFFASLPKGLDDADFIPAVTDIAKKFNIRIMDFSPPTRKESQFYTVTSSKINCVTSDFKSLLRFVHGLETAEYAMSIDVLSIKFTTGKSTGFMKKTDIDQEAPTAGFFDVSLSISSTMITVDPPSQKEQ